jgi:pyruvate formate lyase activating enzyme
MTDLRVGLQKTTLIDYPGLVACVVFFPGCNFRCPYCHNPELVELTPREGMISIGELMQFLTKRSAVLGGVVLSGGEPLLHPVETLKELVDRIRALGLKVKIDTNGSLPDRLACLKPDYIAMDIKTSLENYPKVGAGRTEEARDLLRESIRWIIASGIPHEFRTTVAPDIITRDDIHRLIPLLKGTQAWYLTRFRPGVTLDPDYTNREPCTSGEMEEMRGMIASAGIPVYIR